MQNKSSIFHEILKWSEDKPIWQRDALRRLLESDSLEQMDIDELTQICKASYDSSHPQTARNNAQPLSESHIPSNIEGVSKVCLKSISDTENINALASGQVLDLFGNEKGIVVIYGDNASGKSGYGRVIKRACRARNRGKPIKSNIFKSGETKLAKASITININGKDEVIDWIDQDFDKAELSYISFFDSECAITHANESNDIAFSPFGLDLLENLASISRRINKSLNAEKANLEKQKPAVLRNPQINKGTNLEKLLNELKANTDFSEVKQYILLSDEEKKRFDQLKNDLSQDPNKIIEQLQLRQRRLKKLYESYLSVSKTFSDTKIQEYKKIKEDAISKNEAAKIAAETLFKGEPLPNVGSDIWKSLWESARTYSDNEAYIGKVFPLTEEKARCVLCQQELNEEASNRLINFEKYVKDNSQRAASEANKTLKETIQNIKDITTYSTEFKHFIKEIKLDNEDISTNLRKFALSAELRKRKLLRAFKENTWDQITKLNEFHQDDLISLEKEIKTRIEDLIKVVQSDNRKKLEKEKTELEDRLWASGVLDDIEQEIKRLEQYEKIEKSIKDTLTTSITNKSRQLAEEFVTARLRDRFVEELTRLKIHNVRVELIKVGGEYGSTVYQIQLIAAPNENLKDILSEGEFRCIALAGFLTELATDQSGSTVVFDDPVSSLDHKWRKQVAERLVQEAKIRQVVVFTHDIVFLHDLLDYADNKKVEKHIQRVYKSSNGYGTVGNELPWKVQNTLQRLDALNKMLSKAKKQFEANEEESYEKACADIYSILRATVERAIEEHLFSRVVVRHRDYVNTKELSKIKAIQSSDIDTLLEIHDKCCDVIRAHDASPGRNPSIPNPEDVKKDINKLDNMVRSLKNRKKSIS